MRAIFSPCLTSLLLAAPAFARTGPSVRVGATVERFDGYTLDVKARSGERLRNLIASIGSVESTGCGFASASNRVASTSSRSPCWEPLRAAHSAATSLKAPRNSPRC